LPEALLYGILDMLPLLLLVWAPIHPYWHWSVAMALNLPTGTLETRSCCPIAFHMSNFASPAASYFPQLSHCWSMSPSYDCLHNMENNFKVRK
jgi:hypothetical protein